MSIFDEIISEENLFEAYKKVVKNKGASGVDGIETTELYDYIRKNNRKIIYQLKTRTYFPMPVRRVYIPKANGKERPLGIPTTLDRVIQQAISIQLNKVYEPLFSDNSFGYRENRSQHMAIDRALSYLNEGYEWVVDLDIQKFFDTVNHDKLIQILRKEVNDSDTLNLIRKYLRAGVMEKGLVNKSKIGVPQGGPISVVLSNIYLNELDKELESRGLRFVRYADDTCIFVKSELAANRVMKSISSWIERKLFLKVNATKTKVVRPTKSKFLGFTFIKYNDVWKVKPTDEKKKDLYDKIRTRFKRNKAVAMSLENLFKEINSLVRGWINYFRIGMMKTFIKKFGEWLRHKVRVIIIKQWKKPKTIFKNLMKLNKANRNGFNEEDIFKVANTRLGLYKQCSMSVVNFILSPTLLETGKGTKQGLVNPLKYYLR